MLLQPFIPGPSLKCIMQTPHGDAVAPHIELYSESVLFFTLPPYPLLNWVNAVPEVILRARTHTHTPHLSALVRLYT